MGYGDTIKRGAQSYFLNQEAMTGLADDESSTGHGFLTLILIGLIIGLFMFIGAMIFAGAAGAAIGAMAVVTYPIMMIIGFFIGYSIFHLFAKMFGGQATGTQFFRVIANTLIMMIPVSILGLIPFAGSVINLLAGLWIIVVLIVAVHTVHKLSTGKAIAAVLIPIAIILAIALAFFAAALRSMMI